MTTMEVAKVAYSATAAYAKEIGDKSYTTWDNATDRDKETAKMAVDFVRTNPMASALDLHNAWMAHQKATGGKHQNMRPFNDVTHEQRVILAIVAAVVKACPE